MFYKTLKEIKRGMSLIEILIALFILAVAAMPVIGVFSQYYGIASRQLDNEIALKLAEASINKILAHRYSDLIQGNSFSIPLDLQTAEGPIVTNLDFENGKGTSGDISIGKLTYNITIETQILYEAQNIDFPHSKALEFRFASHTSANTGVPTVEVASYSCTDNLIAVKLLVEYGGPKDKVELACFRADMAK
jgi:prepilin-type N-terminal cleavage/methylation domain-containing protein